MEITPAESFNPKKIQWKTTREAIGVGCFSFICVAATCLCGLASFPLTSLLPKSFGSGENIRIIEWGGLDGMASLATVSFIVGGLAFALIDYVRNAVQRKREDAEASFNIYKEVYDRLMDPKAVEARRWIILNLPTFEEAGKDRNKWLECINVEISKVPPGWQGERTPGQEYLKNVLNTLDFIGFVAKYYWNMENELVRWMSPPIAKVWERIEVYVEDEATRRKEKDYYESAREFAEHCVEWRKKKDLHSEIIENGT